MKASVRPFVVRLASALACAAAAAVYAAPQASADEAPWYRRLWNKITTRDERGLAPVPDPSQALKDVRPAAPRPQAAAPASGEEAAPAPDAAQRELLRTPVSEMKENPQALTVDDTSPGMQTLTSDGYAGPDLSSPREPADEHLIRKFPMPEQRPPQPLRNPPDPQRYAPPPQPPRRRDE